MFNCLIIFLIVYLTFTTFGSLAHMLSDGKERSIGLIIVNLLLIPILIPILLIIGLLSLLNLKIDKKVENAGN